MGQRLFVMEKIKKALDPQNILNPNKVFQLKDRADWMKVLEAISNIAGKYFALCTGQPHSQVY